jgi:hypothetical protein
MSTLVTLNTTDVTSFLGHHMSSLRAARRRHRIGQLSAALVSR